eukprot:1678808-Rhodomonas_salina.4
MKPVTPKAKNPSREPYTPTPKRRWRGAGRGRRRAAGVGAVVVCRRHEDGGAAPRQRGALRREPPPQRGALDTGSLLCPDVTRVQSASVLQSSQSVRQRRCSGSIGTDSACVCLFWCGAFMSWRGAIPGTDTAIPSGCGSCRRWCTR